MRHFVPRDLIKKPWAVYAKQAFGSPENVLEYLGRYTHRVAISNARILRVTDIHITFQLFDRNNGYQPQQGNITGVQFLKRFLEHIVPPHFRRIRYLGFLSNRNKASKIEQIRQSLECLCAYQPRLGRAEVLALKFGGRSQLMCAECSSYLHLLESYPSPGAPPQVNSRAL